MGGGWAIFFCGGARPGRRVRGRGGTLSGLRALLMFAAAWRVRNRALILCQTLCRLRGRCTRPARALPFGTRWDGTRGLVGGHGRLPSPESDWCAFGCGRRPVYARGRVHAWLACLEQSAGSQKGCPGRVGQFRAKIAKMTSALPRPSSSLNHNTGGVSASVTATESRLFVPLCRAAISKPSLALTEKFAAS